MLVVLAVVVVLLRSVSVVESAGTPIIRNGKTVERAKASGAKRPEPKPPTPDPREVALKQQDEQWGKEPVCTRGVIRLLTKERGDGFNGMSISCDSVAEDGHIDCLNNPCDMAVNCTNNMDPYPVMLQTSEQRVEVYECACFRMRRTGVNNYCGEDTGRLLRLWQQQQISKILKVPVELKPIDNPSVQT